MKANLKNSLIVGITALLISANSFGSNNADNTGMIAKDEASPDVYASDTNDAANAVDISEVTYSMAQPANGISLNSLLQEKITYPGSAYMNDIEGTVKVVVKIDKSGKISSVKVLETTDKLLSDEVIDKLESVVFQPATQNGYAVNQTLVVPVTFKLL